MDLLATFSALAQQASEAVNQASLVALTALFLVAALTEVGVPFPFVIDGALFFIAYRKGVFSPELGLIMLSLFLGRVAGSAVIYWLTRFIGAPFVNRFRRRSAAFDRKLAWFTDRIARRPSLAVTIGRLTPGLLTMTSVASGATALPHHHFIAGIALSSLIADSVLVILGAATKFGFGYFSLTPSLWMVGGISLAFYLLWALRQVWVRRHARAMTKSE